MPRITCLLALVPGVLASSAIAQTVDAEPDGIHGVVAIGPGLAPDFEGADSYRVIPLVIANIRRDNLTLNIQGLRMRADVVPSSTFAAGPALNVRLSRDDKAGGRVALLDKIDTAVEAGGFAGLRLGGDQYGQGLVSLDLTVLADVSGTHDGFLTTLSAAYAMIRNERFSLSLDTQATYGSRAYQRTYFGVTAEESARSGLAAYRPGASLRDIGAGATFGYQFNSRWGVIGRLSYGYLIGDAADSPIVREEGSRHQGVAGLAVSYRF